MHLLFILNDPPYGTERTYNGLRLALNTATKTEGATVTVFLMADAAAAAIAGQRTPNGYYNLERMLAAIIGRGAAVLLCGSCMDARGIRDDVILPGSRRSSLDELTALTASADRVLVF
jgi:uncharacterized protein involved in oxidation of intracellular sulfur